MLTDKLGYIEPVPPLISSWTEGWGFMTAGFATSTPLSGTTNVNQGVWFPLYVPTVCVAKRMWWANGSTVSASYNVEAGIYADAGHKPGVKLVTTGSVAQGTATQVQFADITDTVLTPQLYWLYMSCSNSSATFFRTLLNEFLDDTVRFQQDSIGPGSAPATATPVESSTAHILLTGIDTRGVG